MNDMPRTTQAASLKKPATKKAVTAAVKKTAKATPVPSPKPKAKVATATPASTKTRAAAKSAGPASAPAAKHKPKLVRDSFTMPQTDFGLIDKLKARALNLKHPIKKSELLRAGLQALHALDDLRLLAAMEALVPLKAGRPKKD